MFPDPVFQPDESNDHRFGVASYALTYTAYEVFTNLIKWTNPNRLVPHKPELTCGCNIQVRPGRRGRTEISVANTGSVAESYKSEVTSSPAEWTASVRPQTIILPAGGVSETILSVTPPRNAKEGIYQVEVRATSEKIEGLEDHVTATITVLGPGSGSAEQGNSRPAAALVGVPVGMLTLIGIFLVGRIYRRR